MGKLTNFRLGHFQVANCLKLPEATPKISTVFGGKHPMLRMAATAWLKPRDHVLRQLIQGGDHGPGVLAGTHIAKWKITMFLIGKSPSLMGKSPLFDR